MATVDLTVRIDGKRECVTIQEVEEVLALGDGSIHIAGNPCGSFIIDDIEFLLFRDDSVRSRKKWTRIYRGGVN